MAVSLLRQAAALAMSVGGPAEAEQASPRLAASAPPLDVPDLYRRYGDLVLGRCRTLLRNEADAQDALQEVFLKLHRYRDSFRGEASPSTWIFRITTTTCLNRIRTRKRHPEDPVEELPPVAATDGLLDRIAVRDLVDRLLAGMDERTQACVIYAFVDGMTYDEIGEILGITGAAVRKRISTFRASLKESPPPWLQEVFP